MPVLGDPMTDEEFDRQFRVRGGERVAALPPEPAIPEVIDRAVLSSNKVARISDYVALLGDLAHLSVDEALAQFELGAASYLQVARAWAAAMEADPTIRPLVEAGLARR